MLTRLSLTRNYVRSEYIGTMGCFLSFTLCGKSLNRHKLDFATFLTTRFRGGGFQVVINFEGRVKSTLPKKLITRWEALSRKMVSKKLQSRDKGFRPVLLATNRSITLARGDYRLADSVTTTLTSSASGVSRTGRQLPRGRKPPFFNLIGDASSHT